MSCLPTLSRTCDNTEEYHSPLMSALVHPGLFSNFPFLQGNQVRQSEYAFCHEEFLLPRKDGSRMTSLIPKRETYVRCSYVKSGPYEPNYGTNEPHGHRLASLFSRRCGGDHNQHDDHRKSTFSFRQPVALSMTPHIITG